MRRLPVKAQEYSQQYCRRYYEEAENLSGEITVFLALIFILLVSFIGSLMEGASIQMAKNYRRADMNRAMESVFAEYQRELLEEFDVFGMDGSYESGFWSEEAVLERLDYYGAAQIDNEIRRIQLLTDHGGQAFREQAARYVEERYGLESLNNLLGNTGLWKQQEEESDAYQRKEEEANRNLDRLLMENEEALPTENNPLTNISAMKRKPLVELVMPKNKMVSGKQYEIQNLVSGRERQTGYGTFDDVEEEKSVSTLAFGEYLLRHFRCVADESETVNGGGLDYELEYILGGRSSDRENLEEVTKKLLLIRFVPNYAFVSNDAEKRAEAEAMALTLCSLILAPEITEAVTQVLLLGWAFGESIMDIRSLMDGKRVPLLKNQESWQLQLSALLTLGTEEDQSEGLDTESGLTYKEYLRIMFFLGQKETQTMRALDMIELRLRTEKGLTWFYADSCISRMEIRSSCSLRRGISYQFQTYFGYR